MSHDDALLIATGLAAIASVASAVSAYQSRKLSHAATLPDLSIQLTTREVGQGLGLVGATIHNAGSGVARGIHFLIVADETMASNYGPGGGLLRPNEALLVETSIQVRMPMDEAGSFAIVGCRDRHGYTHMWTHMERHHRLRSWLPPFRRSRHTDLAEYVRRRHGIDTSQLGGANSTMVREGA